MHQSNFSEEKIQHLFGNEAGESEKIERLKEYYFKTPVFDQITNNLPLRILVGHKGIGKSALFKIAMDEDSYADRLPILIRPDDILGIAESEDSLLVLIQEWKKGLLKIVSEKIVESYGVENKIDASTWMRKGTKFLKFLADSIVSLKEHWDMDPTKAAILEQFIAKNRAVVYIDDLDRGWEGRKQDIKRISALLSAVRDMSSDIEGIAFRISLRSDVYYLVRTSDESTDKIENSVLWYSWTNHEILLMLSKRILTYKGEIFNEQTMGQLSQESVARCLDDVMEPRFHGRGHWENIPTHRMLMSLIRRRPRDLVKLCTLAARQANLGNASHIGTVHFSNIFSEYSQGRVQDTINEYRTELPAISQLLFGMKPTRREMDDKKGFIYTTEAILLKLQNIAGRSNLVFASGDRATPKELLNFLYKINFLTARKVGPSGKIDRKYFEEHRYVSNPHTDFGYAWEMHPAYRWTLLPESMDTIIAGLD